MVKTIADFEIELDATGMNKGTQVRVVWEDSLHWGGDEVSEREILNEPPCFYTTWGVLLLDATGHLIVVSTKDEVDNMIKEATRIPKSLIYKITVLKEDL